MFLYGSFVMLYDGFTYTALHVSSMQCEDQMNQHVMASIPIGINAMMQTVIVNFSTEIGA